MTTVATAVFDALADLRDAAAHDAAQADAAYAAYVAGTGDFGDRCYWEDRARDAADELFATELAFAYRFLALEA